MPSAESPTVSIDAPEFLGVYLHDPEKPVSTVRHFLYGSISRAGQFGLQATELRFKGRSFPCYDFGEDESRSVELAIDAPFGTDSLSGQDWSNQVNDMQGFAQARTVLCYRDGRGRRVFGVIMGATTTDTDTGTAIAISVERSDYDESV